MAVENSNRGYKTSKMDETCRMGVFFLPLLRHFGAPQFFYVKNPKNPKAH